MGLQIQCETQCEDGYVHTKENSDARPDVNPGITHTDPIRKQRPEASKSRCVFTENSDADSETTETEAEAETDSCQ